MRLQSSSLLLGLIFLISVLLAANVVVLTVHVMDRTESGWGLIRMFNFDVEGNVPSWFSSCLLLLAAVIILIIAEHHRNLRRPGREWWMLGVLFILLSADESAGLHELAIPQMQGLGASGLLYHGWVVPAVILLAVLAALYMRWFLRLPQHTKRLAVVSAALYLGGAIVLEMYGGSVVAEEGFSTRYLVLTSTEETLEMLGLALWVYALVDYGAMHGCVLRIEFASASAPVRMSGHTAVRAPAPGVVRRWVFRRLMPPKFEREPSEMRLPRQ